MASPAPPGAIDEVPVLVDTGVLRIEEMRGPDQLPDKQKKLEVYLKDGDDIAQRSLPAVTGDQGMLSFTNNVWGGFPGVGTLQQAWMSSTFRSSWSC